MSCKQIIFILYKGIREADENSVGLFRYKIDKNHYTGIITESDQDIQCRKDYSEEELFKLLEIDKQKNRVAMSKQVHFNLLDMFTSMNKFLLVNIFPEIKGKWLSVRTKLQHTLPSEYKSLAVAFRRKFSDKYTQSELLLDDRPVGMIYFSTK